MHVLRSLASLLGRVFARLSQILLAWASRDTESSEPAWTEPVDDGPPEHWLRYLRERSPWLVRGNGPAPTQAQGARREARTEARGARPAAVVETQGASRRMQETPLPPGRPAHSETVAQGAKVLERVSHSTPRAVSNVIALPPRSEPRDESSPGARLQRVSPPALETRAAHSAPRAPLIIEARPTIEIPQGSAHNERDSRPAPRAQPVIEPPPTTATTQENDSDRRATSPAPRAQLLIEPPPSIAIQQGNAHNERAPRPAPAASSTVESRDRWPDLPDVRWSEPTWEVPSSQTLVRLQQRQARLQEEQAGSSWSGPRS